MGEADYRTIYAKPSDKLMNVLENNTDAIYMYLNCLPDNNFLKLQKGAAMSNTTKRALENSLKQMLLKKPLDKITISDLTDDCGISRMAILLSF